MPPVNKIAINKKMNTDFENTFQLKISRPLVSNSNYVDFINYINLHFFKERIILLLKNNKNRPSNHKNGLSKTKRQILTATKMQNQEINIFCKYFLNCNLGNGQNM